MIQFDLKNLPPYYHKLTLKQFEEKKLKKIVYDKAGNRMFVKVFYKPISKLVNLKKINEKK